MTRSEFLSPHEVKDACSFAGFAPGDVTLGVFNVYRDVYEPGECATACVSVLIVRKFMLGFKVARQIETFAASVEWVKAALICVG